MSQLKNKLCLFISLSIMVLVSGLAQGSDVVLSMYYKDKQLLNCIEAHFKEQDVTLKGLKKMLQLNCRNKSIADLSGLELLENLESINLGSNNISNIKEMTKLKKLNRVSISNNKLDDLSPLKESVNLVELWVDGNDIVDLEPLKKSTKLKVLVLNDNKIKELKPLAELFSLEKLWLSSNDVSDITNLKDLRNLRLLVLSDNKIGRLPDLESLSRLSGLDLSKNKLKEIDMLSELVSLSALSLENNLIKDVAPLTKLLELSKVGLNNNRIEGDIGALVALPNLSYLGVKFNKLTNFTADLIKPQPLNRKGKKVYVSNNCIKIFPGAEIEEKLRFRVLGKELQSELCQ